MDDTSSLYDTPPSDVTGVLDPSVGLPGSSTDASTSNWLSALTGLAGIGTSIYGAVKAPSVATSVASTTGATIAKIAPLVIGGIVLIFGFSFFTRKK